MGGQDENKENPPPGQREFKVVHAATLQFFQSMLSVYSHYVACRGLPD